MKPFTLLFILMFAVAGSAYSQLEVRPYAGINLSDVNKTPDGLNSQAKVGAQLGGSLIIGNQFYVNPGIAWFSRSTEYSEVGNSNFDQTTNGVIVPIHVGYRFVDPTTSPLFNFRVFAGPSVLFLNKTEFSEGVLNEQVDWKDSQWGAQAGIGLDVDIFFLDAGYEWGITNTAEKRGDLSGFRDFRNNTFFLNVGVRLTLAR